MKELPKGARRDSKSGAIIFSKKSKGTHIDPRILRKIILEMYRVMSQDTKEKMKPEVRKMLELL